MTKPRAIWLAVLLGLLGAPARPVTSPQQPPAAEQAPAATTLSRAEIETFLAKARIVKRRGVSKGITGTVRATLSDGRITHDASIQRIDESRRQFTTSSGTELNFRDTWRFNVAAYELDKLLDLDMVPVSVQRRFGTEEASFTWWVDDVLMDEAERLKKKLQPPDTDAWNRQMAIVRLFDQLIDNTDRNLGNLLITSDWRVWMIDHSRAFRWHRELRNEKNLMRCERGLLEKLRALDKRTLQDALGEYLGEPEISGLLARRDRIVAFFDAAGDKALFDRPRPRLP